MKSSCCEVCDRNPTCGSDCGSCTADVCPTCGEGRYDRATGVVSLPKECCAIYFYGLGSWAHDQWVGHVAVSPSSIGEEPK